MNFNFRKFMLIEDRFGESEVRDRENRKTRGQIRVRDGYQRTPAFKKEVQKEGTEE